MVKRKFLPLFAKLEAIWKQERRNEPLEVFTWRALRHFAVSCWIDVGLPPKAVQTFAGHSSLQVTMDRHGHLFRSDHHGKVMDAISGQFSASEVPARSESERAGLEAYLRSLTLPTSYRGFGDALEFRGAIWKAAPIVQ